MIIAAGHIAIAIGEILLHWSFSGRHLDGRRILRQREETSARGILIEEVRRQETIKNCLQFLNNTVEVGGMTAVLTGCIHARRGISRLSRKEVARSTSAVDL